MIALLICSRNSRYSRKGIILHVNFIIVNPMSQSFAVPIGQPGVRVSPHLVHGNEVAHRLGKRHWESDLLGKSLTSTIAFSVFQPSERFCL